MLKYRVNGVEAGKLGVKLGKDVYLNNISFPSYIRIDEAMVDEVWMYDEDTPNNVILSRSIVIEKSRLIKELGNLY